MMGSEISLGIITAIIAAAVAFTVTHIRISQDRKTRKAEWLRDRIAHLNSCSRALKRFETRLTSKRSDVISFEGKKLEADSIGGLEIRTPEVVFLSDTDKAIFQCARETEISESLDELEIQIDELQETSAEFTKSGPNPQANSISEQLQSLEEISIAVRTALDDVKRDLKVELSRL